MIEVFRTNVKTRKDAQQVLQKLAGHFPNYQFNFDLQDCDKILRVISLGGKLDASGIVEICTQQHFRCERLED